MNLAAKLNNVLSNPNFKRLIRFSAVGAANTLIDFLVFSLFYSVFGLGYIASQIVGYSVGVLNSFLLNGKWTFGDRNSGSPSIRKTAGRFVQFSATNLASLSVSVLSMNALVEHVKMDVYLSKIMVIIVAQLINYLSYKLWVFKPGKQMETGILSNATTGMTKGE